jgi:hypothetical protein
MTLRSLLLFTGITQKSIQQQHHGTHHSTQLVTSAIIVGTNCSISYKATGYDT